MEVTTPVAVTAAARASNLLRFQKDGLWDPSRGPGTSCGWACDCFLRAVVLKRDCRDSAIFAGWDLAKVGDVRVDGEAGATEGCVILPMHSDKEKSQHEKD